MKALWTVPPLGAQREGRDDRRRSGHVEADVWVAPKFSVLLLLAVIAVVLQATVLARFSVRGAHLSLLTVLLVWTGLRCGVTTGGWLGLLAGLFEDALGGSGSNVLGTTLIGFAAGLLTSRFFFDSMPVLMAAIAGLTIARGLTNYAVLEAAFGYRGLFHRMSHELVWQAALNCGAALVVFAILRMRSRHP